MDILIIKSSSFGDIVHGLQVVDSLRRQWEGTGKRCSVTWIAREQFAGLIEASGVAETCWTFPRRNRCLGGRALRARLQEHRFDLVLDLQGRWKTGYWTWRVPADRKIGRADARELAGLLYPEKPVLPPGGRNGSHAIDILLNFLPLLGCEPRLAGPLRFPGSTQPDVDPDVLERRPILIFPDSAQSVKEWPGYRELTRVLANEHPAIPILWPGWSDMASPAGLRANNFLNLMKRVPLKSLPALVGRARLVIANDSGPMHLAAAMGIPVIGIFGPSSAICYGPRGLAPGLATAIEAPGGRLADLSVEAVRAEITACLARTAAIRLGAP